MRRPARSLNNFDDTLPSPLSGNATSLDMINPPPALISNYALKRHKSHEDAPLA
jgi:hypothetical protein